MSSPQHREHKDVIAESLDLKGARVADVGCGDGGLVRLMTRLGARVTGIEPSPNQVARAQEAEPAGDEDYKQAGAESLPLEDAAFDVVVFFNSLHHVPGELHEKTFEEAARVLKPGGILYISEPVAEGARFELGRLVDDETLVRAQAYDALQKAAKGSLFEAERELTYLAPFKYDSFAQFRDHMIAVDERRRAKVEALEDELRASFKAHAEERGGAFHFDQPCRLNILRRRG